MRVHHTMNRLLFKANCKVIVTEAAVGGLVKLES
jgi:hypothetical protein